MWLLREDPEGPTARWIILDREGQPIGALQLPSRLHILWSQGDDFWAVEPDEFEVPWLVLFQMRMPKS